VAEPVEDLLSRPACGSERVLDFVAGRAGLQRSFDECREPSISDGRSPGRSDAGAEPTRRRSVLVARSNAL